MKDHQTKLAENIFLQASSLPTNRFIVAIAGPPASGKSTLAEQLSLLINQKSKTNICEVVPMDGFHYDNSVLDALDLRPRKGAENTFDSEGFSAMVNQLHTTNESLSIPLFDRQTDAVVPNAKIISPKTQILIIEGNYLLLDSKPWSALHTLYDYKIFLKPAIETIIERLFKRWIDNGYDLEEAKHQALSNDIPNAMFVLDSSQFTEVDCLIE